MNYAEWLAALANLIPVDPANANFLAILPRCVEYAEGRLYRELDLLQTYKQAVTGSPFTAGIRELTLPSDVIVTDGINVITPAGTAPDSGTRNPLTPVARAFLENVYPSPTLAYRGLPQYYAMLDNLTILVGPWPDAAYQVEVVQTYRPTALSAVNTTTPLTDYIPDVFLAASMVFMSGYTKDFGAQSDNPQQAQSWENQLTTLKGSAAVEAFRSKAQSTAWAPPLPPPMASPQRG